jgi:hypothetical protein
VDRPDPLRLGKYRVLEAVARGPIAEVLKARLEGIAGFSRLYAVKRVHEAIAADPGRLARIEAEARRAAALSHGNVVQLLDLGRDDDGRPYLVLEWVDGWSLAAVLARAREVGTPLPVEQTAWIALQVLNALEVAHGHREAQGGVEVDAPLLHGALGPDDVLLSRGGEVKVSDFGLAHVATVLAAAEPGLVPGARPASEPSIQGDLRAVAALVRACLTLSDEPASLVARGDVPARLAAAVDALLGVEGADGAPATAPIFKLAMVDALHGRVFTQEALSSWVKALFGLGDAVADELRLDDEPREDLLDDELGLDLDLPDLPAKDDWTAPDEAAEDGRTQHDGHDDGRTLAQVAHDPAGPPARPSATASVAARTSVGGTGSLRTGVLRGLGTPPATPVEEEEAEPWEEPAPAVVDPDLAARLAELRRARPARPPGAWSAPTDEPAPPPARGWVGGAVAAVVLVALGAGLGGVAAGAYGRSLGLTVPAPVLDVHVPSGVAARVHVDGAPVSGPARLVAGSHEVRVEVQGADAWTFDLGLQDGEYRVIVIDAPRPTVAAATPEAPE